MNLGERKGKGTTENEMSLGEWIRGYRESKRG